MKNRMLNNTYEKEAIYEYALRCVNYQFRI